MTTNLNDRAANLEAALETDSEDQQAFVDEWNDKWLEQQDSAVQQQIMEVADLWFRGTARFTDVNTHAAAMAALKSQAPILALEFHASMFYDVTTAVHTANTWQREAKCAKQAWDRKARKETPQQWTQHADNPELESLPLVTDVSNQTHSRTVFHWANTLVTMLGAQDSARSQGPSTW